MLVSFVLDDGLAPSRQQAITLRIMTDFTVVYMRHRSPGLNELNPVHCTNRLFG